MKTPQVQLDQRIRDAAQKVANGATLPPGPAVVPSQDEKFGDYQSNLAMSLAKTLKTNPRALATAIIERLDVSDVCEPPEIAGPGFINLRLQPGWLGNRLSAIVQQRDPRLGVDPVADPKTVVIDFSSPNVAKSMHVGHIRSTVLGDAISRTMRFAGHKVTSDNHLGDWGTPFGLLIAGYKDGVDEAAFERDAIVELERIYKMSSQRAAEDKAWEERARHELARLQAGDEENLRLWTRFMEASRQVFDRLYKRLDVTFDISHGESFYNPMLADTISDLVEKGIAREDDGALAVFFEDDPELKDKPLIVRKRDGAALYSTTDLAGIRYRVDTYHPDRIIIVVDGRQQLYFKQLFTAARKWGYRDLDMVHVWFGSILGTDGKPIKTREGEPIKLEALLDEAQERALALVQEKNPELSAQQQAEIARVVGIGAVKYADLAQNRTSDYVFSWDKMLAMNGNTAPYLQYAYARIQSIFRKGGIQIEALLDEEIRPEHAAELALGKHILRFGEALDQALENYRPNAMTGYLYELAGAFSTFYEACPVLSSTDPERTSRLLLCYLTAEVLKKGLSLLGIGTLPQM